MLAYGAFPVKDPETCKIRSEMRILRHREPWSPSSVEATKMTPRFDKLLVLDLDETLVYATEEPLDRDADFRAGRYYVYRRPGLESFLARCLQWFKVGVWTSSSSSYADAVVAALFPGPASLAFAWSRSRCVRRFDPEQQNYYWIKDLAKLRKRHPLEKILMVDDTPRKLVRNYGNHVAVKEWTGDSADRELSALLSYLEELGDVDNVRVVEKRGWRTRIR